MMPLDQVRIDDRARLARELHDGIAQDLVGLGYRLDLMLADPDASVEVRSQLRTLRFTINDLIDKVRREIFALRQPCLITLSEGIATSAQELIANANLTLNIDETPISLDLEFSYEVLRISQEILRNVAAHAKAERVVVSLSCEQDELSLSIADDGVGGALESETQYGMRSIHDRAKLIDGSLEVHSDGNGTKISLRVPLENYANR